MVDGSMLPMSTAPHVSVATWSEVFQGHEIVGVAVRDRDTLQTLGRQSLSADAASHRLDGQIPTRVTTIFLDDPGDDNVGYRDLQGMTHPRLGVSRAPFHAGVLVASMDRDGDVYPVGGGLDGPFEKIDPGRWPGIQRLRCLGDHTYAIALARRLYRRVGVGQWQAVAGIPMSRDEGALQAAGFADIDAFSPSDLFAVGGHGDVWHFDGQTWRQQPFPSTERLATVTCAGNGDVYVTGEGGSLWVGGRSSWRQLAGGDSSVLWNDTRWFDGRLWLASDYQLRIWNGREIVAPEHEGRPIVMSGHMDAHDGLLAVADLFSVKAFDGQTWRTVAAPVKG